MNILHFEIDGLVLFTPERHGDDRGFFSEVFRKDVFEKHAGAYDFVQDNHSYSATKGTLRGMHYQAPPVAQGKLVRVTRGKALDVIVDIRSASPTFGKYVAVELSAENGQQLWVPPGFLHGFCTLTDDVELLYKVTNYYSAAHDGAVAWNDADIGIVWPFPDSELIMSAKDKIAPKLQMLPKMF